MYEHPIKRAGLSFNRILFSNTRMVGPGFPTYDAQKFNLGFKYRTFEAGKVTSVKWYTSQDLDEVLPARK
jgi:hypothetical protein